MDINVIIASTVGLFVITLLLVTMLLVAKDKLLPSGPVKLIINGEKDVEVSSGDTLLTTLGNNKIFLPSACGGGGTCVQCRCQVLEGGGEILPTEEPHFTRKEISEIKTMVIRLIDRVRLLAEEVYDHDTTARAVWDIGNRKPKHRTRTERREQLQDELADIGKNGDS